MKARDSAYRDWRDKESGEDPPPWVVWDSAWEAALRVAARAVRENQDYANTSWHAVNTHRAGSIAAERIIESLSGGPILRHRIVEITPDEQAFLDEMRDSPQGWGANYGNAGLDETDHLDTPGPDGSVW